MEEGADLITFTSSSTVENFLALGSAMAEGNAGREHRPDHFEDGARSRPEGGCRSARHDIPGLVEAIRKFLQERKMIDGSRSEIKIADEFASAMQQLSAEAEKTLAGRLRENATSTRVAALLAQIVREFQRSERPHPQSRNTAWLADWKSWRTAIDAEASIWREQFKKMDEQMDAIRNTEAVNQRLFDSLHQELIRISRQFSARIAAEAVYSRPRCFCSTI